MKDFPIDPKPIGDKKVAVIGAGPVSLMTAVLLQQRGANVTVFDRDPSAEARLQEGGTFDIHIETGQRALAAAGLLFEFRQLARPAAERVADEQGNIFIDELVDADALFTRSEIDRGDLHRMLFADLQPGTVQWGHHFEHMVRQGDQYILHFTDRPDQTAEVVIGADDESSRLHSYYAGRGGYFTLIGQAAAGPLARPDVDKGLAAAVVLADNLTSGLYDTVPDAIAAYEQGEDRYRLPSRPESDPQDLVMMGDMTWGEPISEPELAIAG